MDMVNLIPPLSQNNKILPSNTMCKDTQQQQTQQNGSPRLKAAPGSYLALLYQENGHVTLPQNQPGKPSPSRGTIYIYGTTEPQPDDKFLDIHNVWNADGTGGNKRGKLLSAQNYDDGRCYQVNGGAISTQRQAEFKFTAQSPWGNNLWCQNDIIIPQDAPSGKPYTLYWVWDWPTAAGVDPTYPNGKPEIYTTCMDIDISGSAPAPGGSFATPQNIADAALPDMMKTIYGGKQPLINALASSGSSSVSAPASTSASAPSSPAAFYQSTTSSPKASASTPATSECAPASGTQPLSLQTTTVHDTTTVTQYISGPAPASSSAAASESRASGILTTLRTFTTTTAAGSSISASTPSNTLSSPSAASSAKTPGLFATQPSSASSPSPPTGAAASSATSSASLTTLYATHSITTTTLPIQTFIPLSDASSLLSKLDPSTTLAKRSTTSSATSTASSSVAATPSGLKPRCFASYKNKRAPLVEPEFEGPTIEELYTEPKARELGNSVKFRR